MKKLFISMMVAIVAALGLTACSDAPNTVTLDSARDMAKIASRQAAAEEAARTDAKYIESRTEMIKLAGDTVRQGKYFSKDNCDVKPEGFASSNASKMFPGNAFGFYREACQKYVGQAVAERKRERNQAVAQAKAYDKKVVIAKQKACEKIASRAQRDACVTRAKHHT
jgi:hypothetical protein